MGTFSSKLNQIELSAPLPESIKSASVKFGSVHPELNGKARPGYYISNNKIIYNGSILPLLQGEKDFQKLKYGYLKTDKQVFYKGISLPFVNPLTFSTITRNNVNKLSRYPEKNNEFVKLNSVLGMDFVGNRKRIYFREKIIHEE